MNCSICGADFNDRISLAHHEALHTATDPQDQPPQPGWWKDANGGWHPPTERPAIAPSATPAGKTTKDAAIGCGLLLGLALLIGACVTFLGGDSTKSSGATDNGAIDVCHQAVEAQLKAPSTADFSGEKVIHTGTKYTVTGAVDAENGFGAKIRQTYLCSATFVSGNNWQPVTATLL